MAIDIIFETHSISEDNDLGVASGWHHSRLSDEGRRLAAGMGDRRRGDGIHTVFSSDLRRAVETAELAFPSGSPPVLLDWRLRECDYGELGRGPVEVHHRDRGLYVDTPYPGGESWRQSTARVGSFLEDLTLRWDGCRVLVIGHVATRWAFEHLLNGIPLEQLAAQEFVWQEGWEYRLA